MQAPEISLLKDVIVPGFYFSGVSCGIKDQDKKDLALILSRSEKTVAAGVFTQNLICAAPVRICREVLKSSQGRAIVINSGIANAATGKQGMEDAKQVQSFVAKTCDLNSKNIFVCSTGKIGQRLPLEKISKGVELANAQLKDSSFADAAQAIMTTDAYPKTFQVEDKIGKKSYKIVAMAKGAGMIAPNMATMLCFVLTDIAIDRKALQKALQEAVSDTLNALTVDGDTSTNDTVLLLASQMAGNNSVGVHSKEYKKFVKNLRSILEKVTLAIALDGEGATKCLHVQISGAKNDQDAKKMALAIGNSNLSKTAIFGNDPNWGRFICAAGYSGAKIIEEKSRIALGDVLLFEKGKIFPENEKQATQYLQQNKIVELKIDLGLGKGRSRVFASDLTYDYIKINAEYRT